MPDHKLIGKIIGILQLHSAISVHTCMYACDVLEFADFASETHSIRETPKTIKVSSTKSPYSTTECDSLSS